MVPHSLLWVRPQIDNRLVLVGRVHESFAKRMTSNPTCRSRHVTGTWTVAFDRDMRRTDPAITK
jgi:hypothetical protein